MQQPTAIDLESPPMYTAGTMRPKKALFLFCTPFVTMPKDSDRRQLAWAMKKTMMMMTVTNNKEW